jgi:hypothetical protein
MPKEFGHVAGKPSRSGPATFPDEGVGGDLTRPDAVRTARRRPPTGLVRAVPDRPASERKARGPPVQPSGRKPLAPRHWIEGSTPFKVGLHPRRLHASGAGASPGSERRPAAPRARRTWGDSSSPAGTVGVGRHIPSWRFLDAPQTQDSRPVRVHDHAPGGDCRSSLRPDRPAARTRRCSTADGIAPRPKGGPDGQCPISGLGLPVASAADTRDCAATARCRIGGGAMSWNPRLPTSWRAVAAVCALTLVMLELGSSLEAPRVSANSSGSACSLPTSSDGALAHQIQAHRRPVADL